MKAETISALDRINRRFYSTYGEEFSATRQKPWPAWDRVLDRFLGTRSSEHATHSILDVGCGNGRFATLLAGRLGVEQAYLGVDSSLRLVAIARAPASSIDDIAGRKPGRRERFSRRLLAADVVTGALPIRCRWHRFHLIVAFGLFHHIPSWERRRSLLVELAGYLEPAGILAVSFWQFGAESRFSRRFVEWDLHNRQSAEMIDVADLERSDHLLRWGDGEAVRYCHFVDPVEAAELTAASGLHRLETFRGDGASGQLNLYHLLQNRRTTGVVNADPNGD